MILFKTRKEARTFAAKSDTRTVKDRGIGVEKRWGVKVF